MRRHGHTACRNLIELLGARRCSGSSGNVRAVLTLPQKWSLFRTATKVLATPATTLTVWVLRYEDPQTKACTNRAMVARRDRTRACVERKIEMATGTVKWFNAQKGFGFIQPDDGGKDVFVHVSAVERAGMYTLNEGQKVNFEITTERGKTAATNLSAV
jgi:cold shock protein